MKSLRKKCCLLLLCVLLAACGSAPAPGGPEYLDSSSGPGGLYSLLTYRDGTGSLLCYDCETMECTYLAGETDPRDENSPAYLPSVVGDAWLLAGSRHLYVLKPPVPAESLDDGLKARGPGWLMRMEPDGTARKTLPLPEGASLVYQSSAVLEGEKLLLLVLCQQEENGAQAWYLAEADFDAGTLRHRLDLEEGTTAHLYGACARGPILGLRKAGEDQQLCLYDLEKNALEPLPFGGEDVPWCLDGRGGVVYYPEGTKFAVMMLSRGRERPPPPACPTAGRRPGSRKWWTATCSSCGENRGKRDTAALPSALPPARCSVPTLRTAGSG